MSKKSNEDEEIIEKIQEVDFESEMGQDYVDYAMSVITQRALPDVRDGLKPVQRRVLYALDNLTKPDGPHRKCARIVGDAMGKYHPHGDSSIYEGLVNMAQDWKAEITLVDPHGNFGAVDGSGAAAMRYTEARISAYTEDVCMKDLDFFKDQFIPNFDETETEPTVLPFQIPNLLVNGSNGIAVGMATNVPTHNLGEVIDATILYLKNEDVTLDELLEVMPGPDFATGGIINSSKENLREIYGTGRGKLRVRGKVEVRDLERGRKSICVTELSPVMINNTMKYLNAVADLVKGRELSSVTDIADRGDKDGECLCVDVKKGTTEEEIDNILNILYKKTELEDTFGVNMNCINHGTPKVMGLIEILQEYTDFKRENYNIKYKKLLEQQEQIKEVRSGLIQAVDCIDLIIEVLRGSKKVADAKACLIHGDTSQIKFKHASSEKEAKKFCFTEVQADAILGMRLQKLIGLELDALKKEMDQADRLIKKYSKLLDSYEAMTNEMIKDLLEIKDKYAVPRRTVIGDFGEVKVKKVEEAASPVAVLLDRFYYIKVIDENMYEKNAEQINKDYRFACKCMSTDRLGLFADDGQMHMIRVQDIIKQQSKKNAQSKGKPSSMSIYGKLSDKGIQVFDFCNMNGHENILFMGCIEQFAEKMLLFMTRLGYAKRVSGSDFDVTRKAIAAYKKEDEMVYIGIVEEQNQVVTKSKDGYYIRVQADEIPTKGKGAGGTRFQSLSGDDSIELTVVGNVSDSFTVQESEVAFQRIKLAKRGAKGTKLRL